MGALRLMLALTVVIGHNQYANQPIGPFVLIAVKAFFIVSGFYMAMILTEKYDNARDFYISRALRIYPMYLFVLAATFMTAVAHSGNATLYIGLNVWQELTSPWALALAVSNITAVGIDLTTLTCLNENHLTLYFPGCPGTYANKFVLVPQAWSMSIELLFYALAPLVTRLSNVKLGAAVLIGLAIRLAIDLSPLNVNPWHRGVAPFEMVYFFLGVVAYRLYGSGRLLHPSLGIGLLAVTPFYYLLERQTGVNFLVENYMWLIYFAALTISLPSLFHLTKDLKWDRPIGDLSYPVYISHLLIMGQMDLYLGQSVAQSIGNFWWLALNISLVIAFSWLCERYVGRPCDNLRYRLTTRSQIAKHHSDMQRVPV